MFTLTKRTKDSQTLHDQMVSAMSIKFSNEGYLVKADIPGYTNPPSIGGYIPDIYATKSTSKIILEAETCDSIGIEHTKEQFYAFSNVLGTEFHVIVPESCLADDQAYAKKWGVKVAHWWFYERY